MKTDKVRDMLKRMAQRAVANGISFEAFASGTKDLGAKICFELSAAKIAEFDKLVADGGFGDRKEMLNNAITLLAWALMHAKKGHAIAAVDESQKVYVELAMPFLTGLSEK